MTPNFRPLAAGRGRHLGGARPARPEPLPGCGSGFGSTDGFPGAVSRLGLVLIVVVEDVGGLDNE